MSEIIIILIFGFVQSIFADKNNNSNSIYNLCTNGIECNHNWAYTGNTKWKIDEKTTLDMEIYCMDRFNVLGNDTLVKHCIFNNSKNKSTRDSFVYTSGILDLQETIYKGNIVVRNNLYAMGVSSMKKYDNSGRIESLIATIDKTGDTLALEFYIWGGNGRLMQTIFNGKIRNFIYGTPCDSVIVEPHDLEGKSFNPYSFPYSRGYNKSFGMIPEKNDLEYEKFKIEPYEYKDTLKVLERQKLRCEKYKESQKKKGGKK